MYFSGWVYIIEQVNLYGINTKQIALKKTTSAAIYHSRIYKSSA